MVKKTSTPPADGKPADTTVQAPDANAGGTPPADGNAAAVELPATVTLAHPFAFYDDDNAYHSWAACQVVDDPEQIALLVERGAIFLE